MIIVNCRKCSLEFEYDPDSNLFKTGYISIVDQGKETLLLHKCHVCNSTFSITVKDETSSGVFTQFFSEGTEVNQETQMNLSELKKMSPMDRMVHWIKTREAVRLKKEAGKPQPWTDDPIIGTYRFCNVRRMDDKVSKWLMDNWYKPYYNHPNMLYAVALARFINLPDSLHIITDHVFKPGKPSWSMIKTRLEQRKKAGNTIFNGAYMVRGNDGNSKIESVVDHNVKPMNCMIRPASMEETWHEVHSCYGFGSFMAGQVVADLRWAVEGTWEDKMTWAPIGPGSQRGMNRLLSLPTHQSWKQNKFCSALQQMIDSLKSKLPTSIYSRLEAHDFQNCLCEYDKYNRVVFGEGRPKQIYRSST